MSVVTSKAVMKRVLTFRLDAKAAEIEENTPSLFPLVSSCDVDVVRLSGGFKTLPMPPEASGNASGSTMVGMRPVGKTVTESIVGLYVATSLSATPSFGLRDAAADDDARTDASSGEGVPRRAASMRRGSACRPIDENGAVPRAS